MKVPGFNAEATVYKTQGNYRTVGGQFYSNTINNSLNLVQAALPSGIFDPFSCFLGCGAEYSGCLNICKWYLPDGSYVIDPVCAKRCWNDHQACRLGCI
jgi:hypothetical protein